MAVTKLRGARPGNSANPGGAAKPVLKVFTAERPHLMAVAYRMLGSQSEAEDVLQDAYLRWCLHWDRHGAAAIDHPPAFLTSLVARLCIDQLRRRKMMHYKGPWLPEPLPTPEQGDPEERMATLESINTGLLLVLEKLSPLERGVFLLHEAFDYSHADIAKTLDISVVNSRQLLSRARRTIRLKPEQLGEPAIDSGVPLVEAFYLAAQSGDLKALTDILCEDVVAYSDGGGKATAALIPLQGIEQVMAVFGHLIRRAGDQLGWQWTTVNGQHGLVMYEAHELSSVTTFDLMDGKIYRIYVMRNPDKLNGFPQHWAAERQD